MLEQVQVLGRAVVDRVGPAVADRPAVVLKKTATAGERTLSTARLPNSGHGTLNTVVLWRPAATNSECPLGAHAEVNSAEKTHGREDTLAWTTHWMDDTLDGRHAGPARGSVAVGP